MQCPRKTEWMQCTVNSIDECNVPWKIFMNAMHPERSRNVSRCGMKLIIPHNGHITNENRADRRARNLISDLICCYRGFPNAVSGRHASWNCFWTFGRYRKLLPAGCRASLICFCGHGGYFYIPKASLEADSFVWGWIHLGKIILGSGFFRMGMILSGENNPCRKILSNGDEFSPGK